LSATFVTDSIWNPRSGGADPCTVAFVADEYDEYGSVAV
jgi:hypothetical protein